MATSWRQASRIAADIDPARPQRVGLLSALGTVLAQPVAALADLPPAPAAEYSGWAVSGIGPWQVLTDSAAPLDDGRAVRIGAGTPVPAGCLGVLADRFAVVEQTAGGSLVLIGENGIPAPRPGMIKPGYGISEAGGAAAVGDVLLEPGGIVTAGGIALAAAAGVDELVVIPPATVAPVVMGTDLLSSGPPRRGRDRDVVAPLLPAWVMGAGGRCLPEYQGSDDPAALADRLDAIECDLTVLTGTAHPGIPPVVAESVRRLNAEILVDELAVAPGGPALLAEFRDGRRLVALPREPAAAVVALATLVSPMLLALSGRTPIRWPTVMLRDGVPPDRTERAVAVTVERGELADLAVAQPWHGPHGLAALAAADGIAFLDPGRGARGESVPVVPLPGREI